MPNYNPATFKLVAQGATRRIIATNKQGEILLQELKGASVLTRVNHAAGYDAEDTEIVVDDASAAGAVGDTVFVGDERVRITAIDNNTETLTVVRGEGETVAAAVSNNAEIRAIREIAVGDYVGLALTNLNALLTGLDDADNLNVTLTAHAPFETFA